MANEGDTVEPGTKIAVISKSVDGVDHGGPSEKTSERAAAQSSPPVENIDKKKEPKVETTLVTEKPKPHSPAPSKPSAREPQLSPKERERRVSLL